MSKRVLVIGGSYFVGRVFAMVASREAGFQLTLLNRGTYSMGHLPGVTEYKCDRHDEAALQAIPPGHYDAVVDFCAYQLGEIRLLLDSLPISFDRYVFISTADVYDRDIRTSKDETAPLQTHRASCAAADYMFNKMLLEGEAREVSAAHCTALTILRPAFIYGPYNYAPRESYFVQKIVKGEPIPVPTDSEAQFQFVYVKDVAEAIISCINAAGTAEQIYNLSAPEIVTYRTYMETLAQVSDIPFTTRPVTVEQVIRENIPLPFPLTREEDELYSGQRICDELGLTYTPFQTGMERAYQAFKGVYSR